MSEAKKRRCRECNRWFSPTAGKRARLSCSDRCKNRWNYRERRLQREGVNG